MLFIIQSLKFLWLLQILIITRELVPSLLSHPKLLVTSVVSIALFLLVCNKTKSLWSWYGKDWGQEEKGTTEDEMVGWHHWLNGHEFGWTPGVGDEQGGLACCGPWGHKESDTTEQLNWTDVLLLNILHTHALGCLPNDSPRLLCSYKYPALISLAVTGIFFINCTSYILSMS